MIIREWRGRATIERGAAYPTHFRDDVVPELQCISGFLGAYLSQRQVNDKIEVLVLTKWSSIKAIKAFAGCDVVKAVVVPGAVTASVDFDDTVQHYEVIETI
jgi:heme-degrading monooxygenase HmoA